MNQPSKFQDALWKVVGIFQKESNSIETNLIPLFHQDQSVEDQKDLKLLAQKEIICNLKLVLEIIGIHPKYVLSNASDIGSQPEEAEGDSASVEPENNDIADDRDSLIDETKNETDDETDIKATTHTESCDNVESGAVANTEIGSHAEVPSVQDSNREVNLQNTSDENKRRLLVKTNIQNIDDNVNNDDDDDVTVFQFNDDLEETKISAGKDINDENKTSSKEQNNNNLYNAIDPSKVAIRNTDAVSTDNNVKESEDASTNPNCDFQDTPTSVPDFRNYNENNQTFTSCDKSLPSTDKPEWQSHILSVEKVTSYLNTLPHPGASLSNSQESLSSNNYSFNNDTDFNDDNLTSISQMRKARRTPKANPTRPSFVNPGVINEDSNKENLPANNLVENAGLGNENVKNSKEKNEDCFSSHSTDDIQIIKEINTGAFDIPIVLNTDQDRGPVLHNIDNDKACETFHVEQINDDQSMTCVSVNLLKTNVQPSENVESQETERKDIVNKLNVGASDVENIDLTGDSDDELDKEIDLLLAESYAVLSTNEKQDDSNNQPSVQATETCEEISDQNNDAINQHDETFDNTDNLPDETLQHIALALNSDNDVGLGITTEKPKDELPDISNTNEEIVQIERSNTEPSENNLNGNTQVDLPDNTEPRNVKINMLYENDSHLIKQESLHIVDDYKLNSQERISILSQGGNFIEDENREATEEYEVIPSVKVEVVMKEESDGDTIVGLNKPINDGITPSVANEVSEKVKKKKGKLKGPLSARKKNVKSIQKKREATKRKKCHLGITTPTKEPCVEQVNNGNSTMKSDYVFKKPGPKSKTTPKKDASRKTTCDERTTYSDGEREINRLTNLGSLNRPTTSGTNGFKEKVKSKNSKKPKLLDFYVRNTNASFSQDSQIDEQHLLRLSAANDRNAEELAKKRILQSDVDEESLLSSHPPIKRSRNLDDTEPKDNVKHTPTTSTKPKPSWKRDPLLTARLDSTPARKTSIKKSISSAKSNPRKNHVDDDDDVQSVCSQIQETINNPSLRENLKKLFEERETIVPAISEENNVVICISSSDEEEEEEVDKGPNYQSDDDLNSVLDETNERELISKFKTTAKIRRRRASCLQRRALNLLNRSRARSESSQDVNTFEDRYKDTPPLVLDVDEETGDMISMCPFYSKILKEHQKRGVQFMWDMCFKSKKKILSNDKGTGCILAHDMGLGKSVQVISLLHTLKCVEDIPVRKILILSPKSLVQNWEDEITKWTKGLQVKLTVFTWTTDKDLAVQDLHQWSAHGGVYILGYQMFVNICKKAGPVDFRVFFQNPGPDLVICDEGHLLKNNRTATHKCLTQIQTRRRIVLTGTPIQNNLEELYNIVSLVQPDFMSKERFREQFIRPISCAQDVGATTFEKNKAAQRISVLHKELEKVMDREQGNQEAGLPPKLNYDIFLHMAPLQEKLYEFFCDKMQTCFVQPMIFPSVRLAELISTHPKSLETCKPVETLCKGKDWNEELKKGHDWHDDMKGAWWKNALTEDELEQLSAIETGVKIKVAFRIVESATEKNEKVLVFSNSMQILDLMQTFLEQRAYVKNLNYFRLDGHVTMTQRKKYLNIFNDEKNTDAKVFLVTHRVGGVGLNFTGANRIIILDMPWNPSHHEQSSNRTHRLGQKKTSYIYRLITKGTIEENIYKTSMSKQSLSKKVVDKKKIKTLFRDGGAFLFRYQKSQRGESKKDLRPAKDDLLNAIFQNSREASVIHSYSEQGELFELSEEQLNEGQAYEEYLLESRTFDVPREKKRRRKRKVEDPPQPSEDVLSNMMTREHLENYNHAELLLRIHNNKLLPTTSESTQLEPMSLSQAVAPPPLVPIPRSQFKKTKVMNNKLPLIQTNSVAIPTHNNTARYNSLSEFITTAKQDKVPRQSNENPNDIRTLQQQLANKRELNVTVVTRRGSRASSSHSNEDSDSTSPSPDETVSTRKTIEPRRRLSINRDIFIHPSPMDNAPPSQRNEQVHSGSNQKTFQNRPAHEQLQTSYQQLTQEAVKALPTHLDSMQAQSLVPVKHRLVENSQTTTPRRREQKYGSNIWSRLGVLPKMFPTVQVEATKNLQKISTNVQHQGAPVNSQACDSSNSANVPPQNTLPPSNQRPPPNTKRRSPNNQHNLPGLSPEQNLTPNAEQQSLHSTPNYILNRANSNPTSQTSVQQQTLNPSMPQQNRAPPKVPRRGRPLKQAANVLVRPSIKSTKVKLQPLKHTLKYLERISHRLRPSNQARTDRQSSSTNTHQMLRPSSQEERPPHEPYTHSNSSGGYQGQPMVPTSYNSGYQGQPMVSTSEANGYQGQPMVPTSYNSGYQTQPMVPANRANGYQGQPMVPTSYISDYQSQQGAPTIDISDYQSQQGAPTIDISDYQSQQGAAISGYQRERVVPSSAEVDRFLDQLPAGFNISETLLFCLERMQERWRNKQR